MFNMVYTGIDGTKSYSISYNPIKKTWMSSSREGKKIYLIPSDLCFIKREKAFTNKLSQLYSYYSLEIEKKFENLPFDISVIEETFYLGVYKGFNEKDFYNVELEPFALARVLSLITNKGYIIDVGKRKTTFVYIENGLLKSYRVVLKGTNYLKELISKRNILSEEESESILLKKGTEFNEIKEGIKEILEQSGYEIKNSPVVLSGGAAYIKGIRELFTNTLQNNFCPPELTSAFGASLKFAIKNPYPTFMKQTLTKEEIKKAGFAFSLSILIFIASIIAIDKIYSVENLREIQKREFKKTFPGTPVISMQEQIKTKFSKGEKYELTKKISNLSEKLKEGITITSYEYRDGILNIKGEGPQDIVSQLNPKSIKSTAKGTVEFEVEIR